VALILQLKDNILNGGLDKKLRTNNLLCERNSPHQQRHAKIEGEKIENNIGKSGRGDKKCYCISIKEIIYQEGVTIVNIAAWNVRALNSVKQMRRM
jgi:hypothetical protein